MVVCYARDPRLPDGQLREVGADICPDCKGDGEVESLSGSPSVVSTLPPRRGRSSASH